MNRQCGGCTLCCKLLPIRDGVKTGDTHLINFHKPAGQRCQHQRIGRGCAVHDQPALKPTSCSFWSCRWLTGDDTADLSRPDRSHYVIDMVPDFITVTDHGVRHQLQVIQIWVDPNHRDAHRDPALRAYIERRAEQGIAALVRYDEHEALAIFAPRFSATQQWQEVPSRSTAGRQQAARNALRA